MRICLLGNNLTNLILANVLANKKLNVDIYYASNLLLQKNDSPRTLAISNENYSYLKNNNKEFDLPGWPTERIKIFTEKKNIEELFEFKNNKKIIFF